MLPTPPTRSSLIHGSREWTATASFFATSFVRDLAKDRTIRIADEGGEPAIAGNGKRAVYTVGVKVWSRNLSSGERKLVSRKLTVPKAAKPDNAGQPTVSRSGKQVVFTMEFEGAREVSRLYLADRSQERTRAVSGARGLEGEEDLSPAISETGRWLAFQSSAPNLAPGTMAGVQSVFATELRRG